MQSLVLLSWGAYLDGGTALKILGLKCKSWPKRANRMWRQPCEARHCQQVLLSSVRRLHLHIRPLEQVIADKANVEAALHKLETENRQRAEEIRKAEAEAQEQMAKAAAAEQAQKRDLILQLRWLFLPGSGVGM